MASPLLEQAAACAERVGYVFIATSDKNGVPHIATAGRMEYDAGTDLIRLTEWFCSKTVANLNFNRFISVAAWQPECDKGYQLQGHLVEVRNTAVLNGYLEREAREHVPQARHELLVKVEKITEFGHAAHSDENLVGA
jgi:predicted pyridoxine 5'-phosphate oxidase superfamily flavin-nucleotide-binding protein